VTEQTTPRARIAWLGSFPNSPVGAAGCAIDLLRGLAELGHEIDCFFPGAMQHPPAALGDFENVRFFFSGHAWVWGRWYSNTRMTAFLSSLMARAFGFVGLRRTLVLRHSRRPYDVLYQFSNVEPFGAPPSLLKEIPLVIHPETHAAGELRWLIKERKLARRFHPPQIIATVWMVNGIRTLLQRRLIHRALLVVCVSKAFRGHIERDYRVLRSRTVVIPNPVRTDRFRPRPEDPSASPRVLVVGRLSVRKGLDTVLEVARELHRAGDSTVFYIIGGPSLWSDYTGLLDDAPPNVEWLGQMTPPQIADALSTADALLQLSKYEPFGLTVAEALAAGVPVVATDEVGAAEGVEAAVARIVPSGDVDAAVRAVVAMVASSRAEPRRIAQVAQREADRLYRPDVVCRQISAALEDLVARSSQSPA
jgi:glycosyltransferase involved in cell wall biosynthesis